MVFSSFRVGLVAGKPVREGMVPFLYCSFWFMKSGKTSEYISTCDIVLAIAGEICYTPPWRDVRVVECAALEKR